MPPVTRFALCLLALPLCAQIRINAGGPDFTDSAGVLWQSDRYFTGGATITAEIPPAVPAIYATKRYGNFSYAIPAPDGAYTLTLYLIESTVNTPGARLFSVTANGLPLLTSYDLFAEAGANVPVKKTFPVTANGAGIALQFTTQARSAFVCAIEIVPAITPTGDTLELVAGPGIQLTRTGNRVTISSVVIPESQMMNCTVGAIDSSKLAAAHYVQDFHIMDTSARYRFLHVFIREDVQFVFPGRLFASVGRTGVGNDLIPELELRSAPPFASGFWFDRPGPPTIGAMDLAVRFSTGGTISLGDGMNSSATAGTLKWEICGFSVGP